ncbi:MAG: hypothetical protein NTZ49_00210 [Candidatus Parcubacteria bacterium]|nr:hypothetical protein [Candidatus Parcubacteria bacterium]
MFISYKQILKQAWQITAHNKILWVFGIFASFVSLENIYEIFLGQITQAQDPVGFYQSLIIFYQNQGLYFQKIFMGLSIQKPNFLGFIAFCLAGATILAAIWFAFTSQIFVIKGTSLIYHGKKITISKILGQSSEKFWAVLSLNILNKLVIYALFIALSLPLLYLILIQKFILLVYVNILFFIFYIILAIIISFITAYAINYIVLKDMEVIDAISHAWKLFTKNILISLEIATILFFIKLLSLIVIFSLFLLFLFPMSIMGVLSVIKGDLLAIVLCLTILVLAFTALSLFINSFFTVFYLSSWTITFIKLSEETLFGKILNLIKELPGFMRDFAKKNKLKIDAKMIEKNAAQIAKEAEKQAVVISQNIYDKYREYKPVLKKRSQKVAKEAVYAYTKFEPIIKRRAKKILIEAQKEWQTQTKPPVKTKRKSKKSK